MATDTIKAIAKTTIKHGPTGETAEDGDTFDCPKANVEQLLELGAIELPKTAADKGKDK